MQQTGAMSGRPLYLASRSPRRQALLQQIGVEFTVLSIDIDETPRDGETPADYVTRIARDKSLEGQNMLGGSSAIVLAADTAVTLDSRILGKPRDRQDGLSMLELLMGRQHQVHSAVALNAGGDVAARLSVSEVTMKKVGRTTLDRYWDSGEPYDKAGAYAIQGLAAAFITDLKGSYSGVMGLPLSDTVELLEGAGVGWVLQPGVDSVA